MSYVKERGFYYPYEEMAPGPYAFTQKELIENIKTVSEWFDIKAIRKRKKEFMSACDGHSAERIFQHVFGLEVSDIKRRKSD